VAAPELVVRGRRVVTPRGATDRPFGLIEGAVTRDDGPPPGRAWE
jgi:hypothetical protein